MSGLRGVKAAAKNNLNHKSLLKGNNINKSDAAKINKTLDAIEIIQKHPDVLNNIRTLPNGTRYTITPYKDGGKTKNKKSKKTRKQKKSNKKQRKTRKH
jgi:hypothetical protein